MKINYILSDTTKNATSSAILSIVKKAEQNPFQDFIVIVPETKSIIIEKEILECSTSKAFANVFVYSFVRLINRLGFVSADKMVSKQSCVLLLRKIIYDNYDNLKCYKKTAKTIGFAEKIYETISQFKSSNVSPEDLKLSLETKSESLKAKLLDIILLYQEYEKALGEGLYDDLDKLNLLAEFSKTSQTIKSAEVFVIGFDNITYEMVSVLKNLATSAKEITFSCVYFNEKREDKHIQTNELYLKFKRIADELKYPYVPVFFKTKKSGDFYNIANYLFSRTGRKVAYNGNIKVFEAVSKKHELDFVASKILEEIKLGKRYKDIGLFVADLKNNVNIIKEVFDEYQIPYFINQDYDVSNHFFAKFVIGAFELVSNKCASDKVLAFVSNPLFGGDDFSCLYNYLQETGLSYESIFDAKEKHDYTDEENKKLLEVVSRLKSFYYLLKDRVSSAKKFEDYLLIVEFIVNYFDVKNKLEQISKNERDAGLVIESEICGQIFEKYEKFNASAKNFMGELSADLDEFMQIYFTGFSSVKLNIAPVSIDSVIVQDNTDGFFDIKTMFIVGAEEGKFPVKIADSGIILDSELEETMTSIKKLIEPTVKDINKRENFRVYEAFLEPSEKLFVSYSLNAYDGKSNKPARVILRLIKLFGEEILTKSYAKPAFVNYQVQSNKFAQNVNRYLNTKGVEHSQINREYNELKNHFGKRFKKFLNELCFGKHDFVLKNAEDLYFFGEKTSVSQLEKYFDCPYLFFANYGLRLKENKNAKLSSIDVGTIIHRVVELFVENLEDFEKLQEKMFNEKVEALLNQAIEESEIQKSRNQALLKLVFIECKRLCKHIFDEQTNSGFKHKKSEWNFEGKNAINIKLDSGRVISIEGKIDRIDEFGNYIRIIDYKTGKVDGDFSSVYYGTKIQLISYLSAVTKYGDKKVAGVFYLPIHSDYATSEKMLKNMYRMEGYLLDDIGVAKNMDYTLSLENKESSFVPIKIKASADADSNQIFEFAGVCNKNLSETDFENVKNYTEELCKNAIEEILSGYNEPAPFASSSSQGIARCSYCKLSGFCGLEKSKFARGRVCFGRVGSGDFDLSKQEVQDEQV